MKKLFLSSIVLAALIIPLCIGLLSTHLVTGHDAISGLVRVIGMDSNMGKGQLYPRWFPEVNFGYGSPMFNFYPPLFYFVGVLFSKIVHHFVLGLNLACILFWMISGVGMYFFAKEITGRKGGFLSAIVYLYAPYHIQDLYVRGALAEFSAFAFFPWILLALLKISQKMQTSYIVLGIISVAGLSLTHNVMSMLFFPLAFSYAVFLSFLRRNVKVFWACVLMLAVGLMVSSFFWLPAFVEKKFLSLIFLFFLHYEFHQSFLSLSQLFNTPWGVNLTDTKMVPYHIGLLSVILALLPLAFVVKKFKENRDFFWQYGFFLLITIAAIALTLPLSQLIWQNIIALRFIQFPWRFLAIITFTVSLLSGGMMVLIRSRVLANVLLSVAVVLVVLSAVRFLYPMAMRPMDADSVKKDISNIIFLGEGEYTPKWIMYPPGGKPRKKFEFVEGQGEVLQYTSITPVNYSAQVRAKAPSLVCFHTFYFPGWKAFVDNKETQIYPENKYGVILLVVPPGEHELRVVFGGTPIRQRAVIISWIGLVLLMIVIIFNRKIEFLLRLR